MDAKDRIKAKMESLEWSDVMQQAIVNTPESGIQFAKDIISPILHPIDTAKAVGGLAAGAAQKMIPGEQSHEKNVDALISFYKGRYGSVDNFKRALAKDPIGVVLGDGATMFAAGGGVLRGLGAASKLKGLQTAGKITGKVGTALDPVNIAKRAVGKAGKFGAEKLYDSAAKFTKTATKPGIGETAKVTRSTMINKALEKTLYPEWAGVEKLEKLKGNLWGAIEGALTDGSSKLTPRGFLFKDFRALRQHVLKNSTSAPADLRTMRKIQKDILWANKKLKRKELTPMELQDFKSSIYEELEGYYKRDAKRPIHVKARQAVARAAMERIDELFEEQGIKKMMKEYGVYKQLTPALEDAASRISKRDLVGIGLPIKVGAGAAAGGFPGAATGLLYGLIDTPQIKARLAKALHLASTKGFKITPTRTAINLGLFQTGRAGRINEESAQGVR